MAETRNVSTYEIDAAKAEESIKRLNALMVQLRETQAKGGDTSAIQAALQAEVAGLDATTKGQEKAGEAAGDLFKRKRDLVDIIGAVNPALGQQARALLEVGDALTGVSGAGMKWNLILGGVTAAIAGAVVLYQQYAAAVRDAAKAEEEAAAAAEKSRASRSDAKVSIERKLAAMGGGAFSPENVAKADEIAEFLRTKRGAEPAEAEAVGLLAAAGGFDETQQDTLLGLARQNKLPADAKAAALLLDGLRVSGADVGIRQDVENFRKSRAAAVAAAAGAAGRGPESSTQEMIYQQLMDAERLPAGTTIGAFKDAGILDTLRTQLAGMMDQAKGGEEITLREAIMGLFVPSRVTIESTSRAELRRRISAAERVPAGTVRSAMDAASGVGAGDPATIFDPVLGSMPPPMRGVMEPGVQQARTTIIQNFNKVGVQYNGGRNPRERIHHPNPSPHNGPDIHHPGF